MKTTALGCWDAVTKFLQFHGGWINLISMIRPLALFVYERLLPGGN